MSLLRRYSGLLILTLCGVLLTMHVIVRPAVGLANNGDFPKMAGPLGLGPEGGWAAHTNRDFTYTYVRDDRYFFNRGFWRAEFLSSEFFLVKLARGLQRTFQPGPRFDIRWLGGVNGAFLLMGLVVWLYSVPNHWRVPLGLVLILIWTDVPYVQYLNSFYMDTAAMIFLVLCIAVGLHVVNDPSRRLFAMLMALAAVLFASSKFQHSVPALVFVPLFVLFTVWARDRIVRIIFVAGCILLILAAGTVFWRIDEQYRTVPVYNMVFLRIAPQASDPLQALKELGLGKNELRFVNTYAYSPHSPLSPQWAHEFHLRCNYVTLLHYYQRHPSLPMKFLYQGLSGPASWMQSGIRNLSLEDGSNTGTIITHFTYWTECRSFLLKNAPWHIIMLVLLSTAGALWLLHSPSNRFFAALLLAVQSLAILEYGLSMLADAAETTRHLLLFHVATEISILLFPLLCQRIYSWQRTIFTGERPSA